MTTRYQERDIQNWSELCQLAQLDPAGGWIFRGVSRSRFGVQPSVGRVFQTHYASSALWEDSVEHEWELLEEFKRRSSPYLPQSIIDNDALSIAQHHGLPTRLLDWTEALFIAGYFAVEDAETALANSVDDDACIFAVKNVPALVEPTVWAVPKDEIRVFRPPHVAPRIVAQAGVFTVHGSPLNPIDLRTYCSVHGTTAVKFIIKRDSCLEIKKSLNVIGINSSLIWPGIEGVVRHLNWQISRGHLPSIKSKDRS